MTDFIAVCFALLLIFSIIGLTRLLTTVIHELGHYIAGSILLNGKYVVYIGSYGDPKRSLNFTIANLQIYFKYNPILWNHGLCVPTTNRNSFFGNFIFILAGPLASFLTIIFSFYILIMPEPHGLIKFGCILLIFSSIVDVFQNLIPEDKPIILYDGKSTFNDGQSLKILLKRRKYYSEILKLYESYNGNNIKEGLIIFQQIFNKYKDPDVIRVGIALYMKEKNYPNALNLVDELESIIPLNSDDYATCGLIYSHLEEYEKSLQFYNTSIQLNPENFIGLNNRGYTFNLLEKYEEAIIDFDKAIQLDPLFAYAYNNRGLAKIKIGNPTEGLMDINMSLELDENNSYAYKNLGIYYMDDRNTKKAKELFYKSKELDPETHGINKLIEEIDKIKE